MSIITQINNFINKHHLIKRKDSLVVGVSGGSDSIALIHILNKLRHELGLTLYIAHFNHQLRSDSMKDQLLVKAHAEDLNIQAVFGRWEHSNARAKKLDEDSARQERFKFLIQTAKKLKAEKIVLAHTKDDLAETVLMRLLRGSGLQGMQAILPYRKIHDFPIIRPMLSTSKSQLLRFLKENKISYRNDPTNKSDRYLRNKIRNHLLPLLEKKYNPNIKEVLGNISQELAVDFHYFQSQTEEIFKHIASSTKKKIVFNKKKFTALDIAQQRMLIRLAVKNLKGNTNQLTFKHSEDVMDLISNRTNGSIVHLPRNISIQKTASEILIEVK